MQRQGPDDTAANCGGLNGSDKALRTPALGAFIDVMHEARFVRFRFGAGKAHLRAAFHALQVFVETLGLALWHCPPHDLADGTRPATVPQVQRFGNQPELALHTLKVFRAARSIIIYPLALDRIPAPALGEILAHCA